VSIWGLRTSGSPHLSVVRLPDPSRDPQDRGEHRLKSTRRCVDPEEISGPADPTHGTLDASILARLEEDLGDIDELIDLYVRALPVRCGSLAQALAARDGAATAMVAHTLGSASAFIGAQRLADLCRELEAAGRTGAVPPPDAGPEVAAECRRVERALRQRSPS
jgi:HPt (histidine-containing phosphotransfer) domain-containing protein